MMKIMKYAKFKHKQQTGLKQSMCMCSMQQLVMKAAHYTRIHTMNH